MAGVACHLGIAATSFLHIRNQIEWYLQHFELRWRRAHRNGGWEEWRARFEGVRVAEMPWIHVSNHPMAGSTHLERHTE